MPRNGPIACHRLAAGVAVMALTLAGTPARADTGDAGRAVFEGSCAGCHAAGSPRVLSGLPLLERTPAITGSDPSSAIRIVLHGRQPPAEQRGPWMPGFATILSDSQIADVLGWLRHAAGEPPWPDLQQLAAANRGATTEAQR